MKLSRCELRSRTYSIPQLRFEDQVLTSFSGLILFQQLFRAIGLNDRLAECVRHVKSSSSYGLRTILLLLVVHILAGWHRLRDLDYYRDDPLVRRVLGLRRLPNVSTVTRALRNMDEGVVENLRNLKTSLVLERLLRCGTNRVTLDFDGSVLSTKSRTTEGTAIGYNRNAKGQRSYYPLFCTVAQSSQVLDVLHRPGNVHDSKGGLSFVQSCFGLVRESGFHGFLEARLDSAHFSDKVCFWLDAEEIEFTISVPFERFPELKESVERCRRWKRINKEWSYVPSDWLPKSWRKDKRSQSLRIIVYRHRVKTPRKGPIQLNMFAPVSHHYEYRAIVTNKEGGAASILEFHNGRGMQEGIFAEMKSQDHMDYVPTRRLVGNQIFLLSAVLAHNLNREMQMALEPPQARNAINRACLWIFEAIGTFRKRLIQRAGRLTRPNGLLTLTVAGNKETELEFNRYLKALSRAA